MMDFGCHRLEVLTDLFGKVRHTESIIANVEFRPRGGGYGRRSAPIRERPVRIARRYPCACEPQDTLDIFGTGGSIHIPVLNNGDVLIKPSMAIEPESHSAAETFIELLIGGFGFGSIAIDGFDENIAVVQNRNMDRAAGTEDGRACPRLAGRMGNDEAMRTGRSRIGAERRRILHLAVEFDIGDDALGVPNLTEEICQKPQAGGSQKSIIGPPPLLAFSINQRRALSGAGSKYSKAFICAKTTRPISPDAIIWRTRSMTG